MWVCVNIGGTPQKWFPSKPASPWEPSQKHIQVQKRSALLVESIEAQDEGERRKSKDSTRSALDEEMERHAKSLTGTKRVTCAFLKIVVLLTCFYYRNLERWACWGFGARWGFWRLTSRQVGGVGPLSGEGELVAFSCLEDWTWGESPAQGDRGWVVRQKKQLCNLSSRKRTNWQCTRMICHCDRTHLETLPCTSTHPSKCDMRWTLRFRQTSGKSDRSPECRTESREKDKASSRNTLVHEPWTKPAARLQRRQRQSCRFKPFGLGSPI